MTSPFERVNQTDLQVRSDGRTVFGIVMPYNVETKVNDGFGPYIEVFRQGAFAKSIRERGDRVKLLVNHEKYNKLPIGVSTGFKEDTVGLRGEFRISDTQQGDEVLTLIRDGVVDSFSAGFLPVIPSPREPVPRSGIVERVEAKLDHVGAVAFPAYEGAQIHGLRFDFDQFWDELSLEERQIAERLDIGTLIRNAAQEHINDTSDEAAPGTSDEAADGAADQQEEPPIEAAERTSDGHSLPIKPAQRPTLTRERLREDLRRVAARAAHASARSA